jgi:hypothetical protein
MANEFSGERPFPKDSREGCQAPSDEGDWLDAAVDITTNSAFAEFAAQKRPAGEDRAEPPPNGQAKDEAPPLPDLYAFNPADWASDPEPEDRKWIVDDYVLDETTTMLSGDGGAGKSYLAHQLTVARALGREWIGLLPKQGRTLYLSCEDNLKEMKRRQYGILKFYNAGQILCLEREEVVFRRGAGWSLANGAAIS